MAYTTAQRLDPSTDEAMEQAERVRAMIAAGGYTESAFAPLPEEDVDDGVEDSDHTPLGSATSKGAGPAQPNRTMGGSPGRPMTVVSAMGGDASGGAEEAGLGKWGTLGQGERDSDCMSCDTSFSNQALLPPGIR